MILYYHNMVNTKLFIISLRYNWSNDIANITYHCVTKF